MVELTTKTLERVIKESFNPAGKRLLVVGEDYNPYSIKALHNLGAEVERVPERNRIRVTNEDIRKAVIEHKGDIFYEGKSFCDGENYSMGVRSVLGETLYAYEEVRDERTLIVLLSYDGFSRCINDWEHTKIKKLIKEGRDIQLLIAPRYNLL